ncbi:hypothetical protein EGM92_19545, partial [Enterobacter cloacae]
ASGQGLREGCCFTSSLKRLQQTGAHINGTVLNDVVKSAALYYRAGYGHYEYGQRPTRQPRKD